LKDFIWKSRFFLTHFSQNLNQHRFLSLCATTSFYFLFTLIPFIILIFLILSKWVSNSDIIFNELQNITSNLLPEISEKIMLQVKKFTASSKGLGWFWFFILFWAASPLANSLRKNFLIIFNKKIKRKFYVNKFIDITILLLVIFLFFSYIFISKYLVNLASLFHSLIPVSEKSVILILFSSVSLIIFVAIFYKIMTPEKKLPQSLLLIGAAASCFVWIFLHEMFDLIMSMSQSYGIFYGSMRNLFISLIWLFLNIAGFLIGVEIIAFIFNLEIYKFRSLFLQPSKSLLKIFFQSHIVRLQKNTVLFSHGMPSTSVYFIVDGQIKTTINGHERLFHNNQYFGELSVINNTKRLGEAVVVSDWAKIIKIPNLTFKKLLSEDLEFQNYILKNLNKIIIN
jgi:membrane protein